MKTKVVIIISLAGVLLSAGLFFFIKGSDTDELAEKKAVIAFLAAFNQHIQQDHTDSLQAYFDNSQNIKPVKRLLGLLAGKQSVNSDETPLASITLAVEESNIQLGADKMITARIPASFSQGDMEKKRSELVFRIRKTAAEEYKIMQVDAKQFLGDYIAYENLIRTRTLTDADIYSPVTLASFKVADELKKQYDSVIWFSHIKNETWYYVTNGKWFFNEVQTDAVVPYKMGLVGPDLKLVIPVEYSLVHTIGTTFENLIEVEKDNKKGFYDLKGKIVVPVEYEHIFPVNATEGIAVLNTGNDFYWLKNDYTISEKVDLKIGDVLEMLKQDKAFTLKQGSADHITEFNSRYDHGSIYIPSSYLVDLNFLPSVKTFENPLRRNVAWEGVSTNYTVKTDDATEPSSGNDWLKTTFYSIRDYFLGGRSEFYDKKNLVVVDRKNNRFLAVDVYADYDEDAAEQLCQVPVRFRALTDSLYEIRSAGRLEVDLYDTAKYVFGGTSYSYFTIRNNKLVPLETNRRFAFTKYTRMDDSYLGGCYEMYTRKGEKSEKTKLGYLNTELLEWIKNDIYADYAYKFTNKRWAEIMEGGMAYYQKGGDYNDKHYSKNVEDSLTAIDKYNIDFINQKINSGKTKK